jgi:hypothetical protein
VSTSTDPDEGTSNAERIASEVQSATRQVNERFSGYQDLLAQAAMECFKLTAEHDEQRININQKYDQVITSLAQEIGQNSAERG